MIPWTSTYCDPIVAVLQARDSLEKRIPLLIKIAPDLILAEMEDIAEVALYPVCSYLVILTSCEGDHLS